jgi:hypothetical protein
MDAGPIDASEACDGCGGERDAGLDARVVDASAPSDATIPDATIPDATIPDGALSDSGAPDAGCTAAPSVGTAIRLTTTSAPEWNPRAATNGAVVGVVWGEPGVDSTKVWFELLDADANPIAATLRRLDGNAPSAHVPDILWNGSAFVVVYNDRLPLSFPVSSLMLQWIDDTGVPMGPPGNASLSRPTGTTLYGTLRLAYSPVSGYAVANNRGFQYLGTDGLTASAANVFSGSYQDLSIAGAPTGEWGLLGRRSTGSTLWFSVLDAGGAPGGATSAFEVSSSTLP